MEDCGRNNIPVSTTLHSHVVWLVLRDGGRGEGWGRGSRGGVGGVGGGAEGRGAEGRGRVGGTAFEFLEAWISQRLKSSF